MKTNIYIPDKVLTRVCQTIQTWNNTNVLADITELVFQAPASSWWLCQYRLAVEQASVNSDFQIQFSFPAGAGALWGTSFDAMSSPWKSVAVGSSPGALYTEITNRSMGGFAGIFGVYVDAIIALGATEGNVALQAAPVNAVVEDTKILTTSCLVATRLF